MDGRDIGTVVLPNADLKIFLTASAEARARRRMLELQKKGMPCVYEDVLKDIRYRDEQDSCRDAAPLRRADDAVLVDTTELNFDESFAALSQLIIERFCLQPFPEGETKEA
jgi:cytidylate kinase